MTAIELAERLDPNLSSVLRRDVDRAAYMLRRQHEAIVKLRGAITQSQNYISWPHTSIIIRDLLEKALKDTEDSA